MLFPFLSLGSVIQAQTGPIDPVLALQYFREARDACDRDGGKLWGARICGPILFVEPKTRRVITNQGDAEGLLTRDGDVFVGLLPSRQPIENAPIKWGGVKWAMIVWSFLTDRDEFQRVKLIVHESYHRIQNELRIPLSFATNDHLDMMEARIWLQLEWKALQKALRSKGAERRRAVEDALTFRNYRRALFPGSDQSERTAELQEGLAEYTGFKIASTNVAELSDYLIKQIGQSTQYPTFVSSFAYPSGPAYAVLLDAASPGWLKDLKPQDDLGKLLQHSLRIRLRSDLKTAAEKSSLKYDGGALRLAESAREAARQKQMAEYRKRFVEGPVLILPLTDIRSVTVNSSNIVPLDGIGKVHLTARVTDEWGILEVTGGAMMISEPGGRISKVVVSIPSDLIARSLKGPGWTLQLNPGWELSPDERKGDFALKKLDE